MIAIIVIGAVLVIIGLVGDKGSGYDAKDEDTAPRLKWLALYFFCLFAVMSPLSMRGLGDYLSSCIGFVRRALPCCQGERSKIGIK